MTIDTSVARGVTGAATALAAGGYVVAQPINRTMDYDTSLRHATNTMYAGKTLPEKQAGMVEINKSVMDAAYIGGTTRESALATMNTMVASGAMSDESIKHLLPFVMKTATAANANPEDIANVVTKALQTGFKEQDIPALLDRAKQSGDDGGFELNNMARWLPQQFAAMKNAGMAPTLDNFSSIANANQMAFMTAGSADEAGNNLVNLLAKITSEDTMTKAKKIKINGEEGFDFTKSMNNRQAAGMNSLDAMVDIARVIVSKDERSRALMEKVNAAGNDEAKLALLESQKALVDGTAIGQLVSDRQALMALLALINNAKEGQRLQEGQAAADGAVQGSYDFVAQGAGFKTEQAKLAKSEVEYDAFEKLTSSTGDFMSAAADWMRSNSKESQALMLAGYGGGAIGVMSGAWSLLGNGGSLLTGLRGLFGMGAATTGTITGTAATAASGTTAAATGTTAAAGSTTLGAVAAPLAIAATPLALMAGASYAASRRDKYDQMSRPFVDLSKRLSEALPDFSHLKSSQERYLKMREELGGNNAPAAISQNVLDAATYQAGVHENTAVIGTRLDQINSTLAAQQQIIQVNSTLTVDGRAVAEQVSRHQVAMFGRGAAQ